MDRMDREDKGSPAKDFPPFPHVRGCFQVLHAHRENMELGQSE